MSNHVHKNNKEPAVKNRIDTVTSVGPDTSYISEEDIKNRAYEIHQQKGGSDIDNWLEAERMLREEQRSISK